MKLAIVTMLAAVLTAPVFAADFEGERFTLIEPFPGSERVKFEKDERVTTRRIILGALQKINNVLVPEAAEYVRGSRTAITWHIPDERRTAVVGDFFRDQVVKAGQILYECRGRDCGSSNYWANTAFKRPILYGPEEDQHYILAKLEGDAVHYVAIYIAQRGTRELYSHLDIVTTPDRQEVVDVPTIERALAAQGKFILPLEVDEKALAAIVKALRDKPAWRIAVVGHDRLQQNETPKQAMARTEQAAGALVKRLVAAGLSESRLDSFGVGPLAPMSNENRSRLELVVLRAPD